MGTFLLAHPGQATWAGPVMLGHVVPYEGGDVLADVIEDSDDSV